MNIKIHQIIPANGWYALYEENNTYLSDVVAAWALVEIDNDQVVYGLVNVDGYLDFPHEAKNFTAYVHESDLGEWEIKS